ncbi:dephospho-CoA kinase [Actinospica robiniae]|uniref:dephospho-CoA kinase n=1 Tax=Actinospica robiniae TaxID=304901 RepID=UPI000551CACE|nr:dephospho-CoA kinase [Actinospica robiniae]
MRTLHVGLTGGIGAGKSAVAARLADHGAVVLDADLAARAVVEPGTDALAAVVEAFGEGVLAGDGSLDRAALAELVFSDTARREELNRIIHPRVRAWMAERAAAAPEGSIVVQDIPLLVEGGLVPLFDFVIVVDARDEVRIDRLVRLRGMSREQAESRIAAQAPRERRNAAADRVIENDGTQAELVEAVGALWRELTGRRDGS